MNKNKNVSSYFVIHLKNWTIFVRKNKCWHLPTYAQPNVLFIFSIYCVLQTRKSQVSVVSYRFRKPGHFGYSQTDDFEKTGPNFSSELVISSLQDPGEQPGSADLPDAIELRPGGERHPEVRGDAGCGEKNQIHHQIYRSLQLEQCWKGHLLPLTETLRVITHRGIFFLTDIKNNI